MSSAYSITKAVNPPRAVYLDYPLGRTAGKPHDKGLQRKIMIDTLTVLETIQEPGTIRLLPHRWADQDDWKDGVMRPRPGSDPKQPDDRIQRFADPQYQTAEDRAEAEARLADGGCPGCVFLEDSG